MKYNIPTPITDENFNLTWDYANNKLIELQKKKIIRKCLTFVSNILFLFCISIITYDILRKIPLEIAVLYFDSIEFAKTAWITVSPIIYHPEYNLFIQIGIYFIFTYFTIFLASGFVFLMIWFLYKPKGIKSEAQDKAIDSKILYDSLKEIELRGRVKTDLSSFLCALLYIIELMALVYYFLFFLFNNADNSVVTNFLPAFLSLAPLLGYPIGIAIFIFGVIYGAFNNLMSFILQPFYRTMIDESIKQNAENYYYECNPDAKAEFEEEEHILQRAKEITAKRKAEHDSLLQKINYKNPIYKYIKLGIMAIIMIVSIAFLNQKLKEFDFAKLLNDTTIETNTEQEVENESY